MKTKLLFFALGILSLSTTSYGAFVGVTLGVRLAYQDVDFSCVTGKIPTMGINLNGEVQNGKLVSGTLSGTADASKRIELTLTELSGFELKIDAVGDYYVTSLPLTARLINFVLFNNSPLNAGIGGCTPFRRLATLSPYGFTYHFVPSTTITYISPLQRYRGIRDDGTPYAVKLGFYQAQANQ